MTLLKQAAARVSKQHGLPEDALYKQAVANATKDSLARLLGGELQKEAGMLGTAEKALSSLFRRGGELLPKNKKPFLTAAEEEARSLKFLYPYMAAVGGIGAYTALSNGLEPLYPMRDKNDKVSAILATLAGGSAGALATNAAANMSGEDINPRTVALATLLGSGLGFGANALYKGE